MPHFFLNLRNGQDVPDLEGQDYPDLPTAMDSARKGALELMAAQVLTGRLSLDERIVLTDEDGKVVGIVQFRDLLEIEGLDEPETGRISPAAAR
jgi:hypothetical protein